MKLAMKCAHCCLWCLECCLKYLTKFAYVNVASDGDPFCPAAVKTFRLVSSYPLQMLTNEATLWVLTLLMTLLTPLVCALLGYFATVREWRNYLVHGSIDFAVDASWANGLVTSEHASAFSAWIQSSTASLPDWAVTGPPSALTVAGASLVVSFWITQMFRAVYATTVDTLFVCMFRDDDFTSGAWGGGRVPAGSSTGQGYASPMPR